MTDDVTRSHDALRSQIDAREAYELARQAARRAAGLKRASRELVSSSEDLLTHRPAPGESEPERRTGT